MIKQAEEERYAWLKNLLKQYSFESEEQETKTFDWIKYVMTKENPTKEERAMLYQIWQSRKV